jgi:hypothetical protein
MKCPRCNGKIRKIEHMSDYFECEKCYYTKIGNSEYIFLTVSDIKYRVFITENYSKIETVDYNKNKSIFIEKKLEPTITEDKIKQYLLMKV